MLSKIKKDAKTFLNTLRYPFYGELNNRANVRLVAKTTAISKKNRYVYSRIPKAANSTVVASLVYADTGMTFDVLSEVDDFKQEYYANVKSLTKQDLTEIEDYFKFTVVRNPYNRILSAYIDKIQNCKDRKREIVAKRLGKATANDPITTADFIQYLADGGLRDNAHWAPQVDLLAFNLEDYDRVGKVENLTEDLNDILHEIFGKDLPIVSITNHSTKREKKSIEFSEQQRAQIYELYRQDFETFGYAR